MFVLIQEMLTTVTCPIPTVCEYSVLVLFSYSILVVLGLGMGLDPD